MELMTNVMRIRLCWWAMLLHTCDPAEEVLDYTA